MKRSILMTTLSLLMMAFMTTAVFAEDVFVTKRGKKYHKAGSRFIKNKEVTKMTREEAEAKGLKPSIDFQKVDAAEEPTKTSKKRKK